jgi:hypothetical protein
MCRGSRERNIMAEKYREKKCWKYILRCKGRNVWRDEVSDRRFKNIDAERDIRRIVE